MSVLDQWQDRWEFAAYNHEQRFQTALVTKRRLFNAIINYPLTQIQNEMLRPDLVERDPTTGKKIRKIEFDAAAWRFIDDVVIGAGGGQFVRSFAFAYGNNRDFRNVHGASRALEGFAMAAESHDTSSITLSEEIKAGRSGVIYDLVNHSADASELLDQFVHGRLDISPSNVSKLQRHLGAMAHLCEERAELKKLRDSLRDPEELRKEQEIVGEGNEKASGYIRDVMRLEKIQTPRQAQILSGFVAALMVDAAKPLGTEMYIPQNDIFMPPEDAVKLSQFVEQQMEHRGFVPNVSLHGAKERPFPELEEGAMIRALRDHKTGEITGYEKLSQAETMSFANAMHGFVKRELGGKVENMLRFVDKNFGEIENSISRSKENPIPEPIPIWKAGEAHTKTPVQEKVKQVWEKGRNLNPLKMVQGVSRVAITAGKHVTRPEAIYENNKLFGRAIAGQIVSYPVKVIDEALKSFLRPGKGLDKIINASKTGVLEGELFDRDDFNNNIKSSTFRLFTAPLAASFGTVLLQELYHTPKGLAIEASDRADSVLKGAIKTGHRHAPNVAERMKAMRGEHPSVKALLESDKYKAALPAIASKKPEERSEQDYTLLASYYNDLSEICLSVAEEALSPYGVEVEPDEIESMDKVMTRVLREPAKNMPDAMMALAYVQTFIDISKTKTASVEYVSQNELLIGHKELKAMSNFVDEQAKAAGLTVAKGDEFDGVNKGELLQKDPQSGKLQPANEETLVRFANVVTEELKQHVEIDNLLYAIKGKHSDEYLGRIENSVFGEQHYEVAEAGTEKADKGEGEVSKELTERWQNKVKRQQSGNMDNIKQNLEHPEVKHEVRKLLGRSRGESISAFMPGLIYNSLQHNEKIFSRSGLYSAAFKTVVYPLMYSYGLVSGKEAINETFLKRRHTINEANVSQNLLAGAMSSAGRLDAGLRETVVEANQINADMIYVQKKDEFKDIPRIAAKPRMLRTESDDELMESFCKDVGDKVIDNSTRIFTALGQGKDGESVESVVERALHKPVDNLGDAVITMGFMHTMLEQNANNLDVLRYVKPEDKVLNRKQVRALAEFMNDQAANAGFALHGVPVEGKNGNSFTLMGQGDDTLKDGELLQWSDANQRYERAPEEAIIRYANVVTEKFRELASEKVKDEGASKLAEKYKLSTKERIFKHLRTPTGLAAQASEKDAMPQAQVDDQFRSMTGKGGGLGGAWTSDKKFSPQQVIDKEFKQLLDSNGLSEADRDGHRARVLANQPTADNSPTR